MLLPDGGSYGAFATLLICLGDSSTTSFLPCYASRFRSETFAVQKASPPLSSAQSVVSD